MGPRLSNRLIALGLAGLLAGATPAFAQQGSTPTRSNGASTPDQTPQTSGTQPPDNPLAPLNLDRIRKGVNSDPAVKLNDDRLRYYVLIVAKQPKFSDYLGDFNLKEGPVPGAGMTFAEFKGMVTPKELYGSGGFTATEMLTNALVNLAGQAIIKTGIKALREAVSQRQVDYIRARIDRELAALMGGKG
jgi:hypothetical protein